MRKSWLRPLLNCTYILDKIVETEVDEYYGTTTKSTTTYEITGKIIPFTLEDVRLDMTGKTKLGDARGYFFSIYPGEIRVQAKDKIEDIYYDPDGEITETIVYEVETKFFWKDKHWEFIEVYLRRLRP